MPDGLIEGYEKILKIFFGDEHKKSISAVIYFTAGIIGAITVLVLIQKIIHRSTQHTRP